MKRSLLDTDIFSEILKEKDPSVLRNAKNYRAAHGRFTITAITVMEIVKGFRRRGKSEALPRFVGLLDACEVLDFDRNAAELTGSIVDDLERTGRAIGWAVQ